MTANGFHTRLDGIPLIVQHHIAVSGTIALYIPSQDVFCLADHKEDIMPAAPQHDFKVVNDVLRVTNAAACIDDDWSGALG